MPVKFDKLLGKIRDKDQIPDSPDISVNYVQYNNTTSLPTPSVDYRGKSLRVSDNLYICLRQSTGVFSWKQINN